MKKVMDIICLCFWIFELVAGIFAMCGELTIRPGVFVCATLVCVVHYIGELIRGDYP